jgi:signal peptidase I
MAADHDRTERPSAANVFWENVKQIGLAVVLALFIKTSVVEAYKIPSASMEDTLLIGDFLLANKFVYGARLPLVNWRLPALDNPEAGDVVIFIFPGDGVTKYIKRCVAVSGDTVLVKNKALYINRKHFADGPLRNSSTPPRTAIRTSFRVDRAGKTADCFGRTSCPGLLFYDG